LDFLTAGGGYGTFHITTPIHVQLVPAQPLSF
jgi:hypothetical protein